MLKISWITSLLSFSFFRDTSYLYLCMTPPPPPANLTFFYLRPAPDIRPGTTQPDEEEDRPFWTAAGALGSPCVPELQGCGPAGRGSPRPRPPLFWKHQHRDRHRDRYRTHPRIRCPTTPTPRRGNQKHKVSIKTTYKPVLPLSTPFPSLSHPYLQTESAIIRIFLRIIAVFRVLEINLS